MGIESSNQFEKNKIDVGTLADALSGIDQIPDGSFEGTKELFKNKNKELEKGSKKKVDTVKLEKYVSFSESAERLQLPEIIQNAVSNNFHELKEKIKKGEFYPGSKSPFYEKDGGDYDYFIRFDSSGYEYVDTDFINEICFTKYDFKRAASRGNLDSVRGELAYDSMKAHRKKFISYLNDEWKDFYRENGIVESPNWYVRDFYLDKKGYFNDYVNKERLDEIVHENSPDPLKIFISSRNELNGSYQGVHLISKNEEGKWCLAFRGSASGNIYLKEPVKILAGDKIIGDEYSDYGGEEDPDADLDTYTSNIYIKSHLQDSEGDFRDCEEVRRKSLDQMLNTPLPSSLTIDLTSNNVNGLLAGKYNIILLGGKYYFKDVPSKKVRIFPGDSVGEYDSSYDGMIDTNPNPDQQFYDDFSWLIMRNDLMVELASKYGANTVSLCKYLSIFPYTFNAGRKKYTADFSFDAVNNLNLLKGILETQSRCGLSDRDMVCKKYQGNINEFLSKKDSFSKIFFVGAQEGYDDDNSAFSNINRYREVISKANPAADLEDYSSNTDKYAGPDGLVSKIESYCKNNPSESVWCSINLHGYEKGGLHYGKDGSVLRPHHLKQLASIDNLTLDLDCCFGSAQIDTRISGSDYVGISSGSNSATYSSTENLIKAYQGGAGDYDLSGNVSHNEARFYQMMHYTHSLLYTGYESTDGGRNYMSYQGTDGVEILATDLFNDNFNLGSLQDVKNSRLGDIA